MSWLSTDSRFYRALGLATDLVLLNLLLVLVSLPVVTAGAGLVGCLVVCLGMVTGDGVRPRRTFFTAFAHGLVPATVAWLGTLALAGLMVWEWLVAGQLISAAATLAIRAVLLLAALLLGMVSTWFWPLLARRATAGNPVRLAELAPLLRTALLASIKYLPRSLLGMLIVVIPPLAGLVSVQVGVRLLLWFVLIGWALASYLVVLVLRHPLGIEVAPDEQ
ncbi:MAG: DUF624 domain-containing protein [Brooklawnia sp.]|jgi:hypothetical protein